MCQHAGTGSAISISEQVTAKNSTRLCRAILVSATAVLWSTAALGIELKPPDENIPPSFFGLNIIGIGASEPWPMVPFSGWRNFHSTWTRLEPFRGGWDFSEMDRDVALAQEHGVETLPLLMLTPRWASARPDDNGVHGPGTASEAADIEQWRRYVRTIAGRYKGRVRTYELWNEPNVPKFFSGKPEDLAALNRVAYETLKEVDPGITVVSPSASLGYLEKYLLKGGGKYADVIGYHFYVPNGPPEAIPAIVAKVRELLTRHGQDHLQIWNTESGWPIETTAGNVRPISGFSRLLSHHEASAYLARAYILNWASGVRRFYWYAWRHQSAGLVEQADFTHKPAAIAYREVARWLIGARMTSCNNDHANTWRCELSRPGGYYALIAWNPDKAVSLALPVSTRFVHIRRLDGSGAALSQTRAVPVGALPVLVENQAPAN